MNQTTKDVILITIGSFLFAIGINYFAIPNHLSEGGVIGITIVAYYLFEWSPAIVNLVLNSILLAVGYRLFNKRTTVYTLISILLSSLFLHLTSNYGVNYGDTLLAALFAGLFVGVGIGLIFRAGGTSGGSAVLARIANQFLGWGIGKGMLIIDIAVIIGSIFIIGQEKAMYTLIAVYIAAKVIDFVIEGINERSAVLIISNHPDKVLEQITGSMSRGLTILEGRGGYTGEGKDVLYLVINSQEIVHLKSIIEQTDPEAYITVHHVQEIVRTGYKAQTK